MKKKLGIALVAASLLIYLADRFTNAVSGFLAELFCGNRYLKPVNGIIGEDSCGFNADVRLTLFLGFALLVGIALFLSRKNKGYLDPD